MALTWFAHIPFLASLTPSPVWNTKDHTISSRTATSKRTNKCTTVKCGTNPVDEDIFRQTRVRILDPAEGVHHFSTVQLLNQLLQSSIWYINIVEKSNGYCGWLCNCGHFSLLQMMGWESRGTQSFCADIPVLELHADHEIPAHIWYYHVEIIKPWLKKNK